MVARYKKENLTSDRRAPRRHNRPAASDDCVNFVDSIDDFVHRTRIPFIRYLLTTLQVYHYFPNSVKGGNFRGIFHDVGWVRIMGNRLILYPPKISLMLTLMLVANTLSRSLVFVV